MFTARYGLDMYDSDEQCGLLGLLHIVGSHDARVLQERAELSCDDYLSQLIRRSLQSKRSTLNGDHVHPSTYGLVSATKPLVGFS